MLKNFVVYYTTKKFKCKKWKFRYALNLLSFLQTKNLIYKESKLTLSKIHIYSKKIFLKNVTYRDNYKDLL
jgi:hypothetical protein